MKRVMLTGASGFIGSHVATALLDSGYEVRALVRPGSTLPFINPALEAVSGDILDADSVAKAVEGCDAVIHTAALYTFWTPRPKLMYDVNVGGTRTVLDAAIRRGVERIVYTSTVSTVKLYTDGRLADETLDAEPSDLAGHYKRSKFQAEMEARRYASEGAPIVIVNPTFPVGPRDMKPSPTGQTIVDFLRRAFPAFVDTGINVVDVRDVAKGHVLALERGTPGQRYLLGSAQGNMTLRELLGLLSEVTGLPAPNRRVPWWLALTAAYIDHFIEGMLLRRQPRIPLEGTKHARKVMWVDPSKAIRELGLPQSPVKDALRKAVEWYISTGYVDKSVPPTA